MTPTRKLPPRPHPHFWPKSTNILYGRPHLAWNFQIPSPPAIWTSFMFAPFSRILFLNAEFFFDVALPTKLVSSFPDGKKATESFRLFSCGPKMPELFRTAFHPIELSAWKSALSLPWHALHFFRTNLFMKDYSAHDCGLGAGMNLLRGNPRNYSSCRGGCRI